MVGEDLVVINGQLCSKDVAAMLISKVLPTVLDVIAEKVRLVVQTRKLKRRQKQLFMPLQKQLF